MVAYTKYSCGVVLYNPCEKDLLNINRYINFFEKVYIFDNSDNNEENYNFDSYDNVEYITFFKNMGLSIAYDKMACTAQSEGFDFLFLFDQDSDISLDSIQLIINQAEIDEDNFIGMYCPQIIYNGETKDVEENCKFVDWCISSGSMIKLSLYNQLVSFDKNYFIDRIDKDYSKQLIENGYKICEVSKAFLNQQLGETVVKFGKQISDHSAIRHYYMSRNRLYYNKKFHISFFISFLQTFKHILYVIMYSDDKKKKISYIAKGYQDFKKQRFGQLVNEKNYITKN